ncbi:protein translocase subunit SecF [Estrella lausannensis]|uniref:Protein-export membrane protein SecF n=1 Tax=Estrella lausannensis TaxID=483423 RepID=A0A0H5E6W0_9BACT|nr:protein translocase subunit SecF [Estrella lausannensis]CRX39030.1 Putative bifunctional preprotein translocase subunit SecD/SecF [Estrella lausannensis]
MEKQKRWQLWLIIAVVALTLYNILPTVFYYSNPLRAPIDLKRAESVAKNIVERVNDLEEDSIAWTQAYCKHIGVQCESVAISEDDPGIIRVKVKTKDDALRLKKLIGAAGQMISFVPAQLELAQESTAENLDNIVLIQRQIPIHLSKTDLPSLFKFSQKRSAQAGIQPLWKAVVEDRVTGMTIAFAGQSRQARALKAIAETNDLAAIRDTIIMVAQEILETQSALKNDPQLLKRAFAAYSQIEKNGKENVDAYLKKSDELLANTKKELETLTKEIAKSKENEDIAGYEMEEAARFLAAQEKSLSEAIAILKKDVSLFKAGKTPMSEKDALGLFEASFAKMKDGKQTIDLNERSVFVKALVVDWQNDKISLQFYPEIEKIRLTQPKSEAEAYRQEKTGQMLISEIAMASQSADEDLQLSQDTYATNLSSLTNPESMLVLDLGVLAKGVKTKVLESVQKSWKPLSSELQESSYPRMDWETFAKLPLQESKLGIVVYAPSIDSKDSVPAGFRKGSIYVIARGIGSIAEKWSEGQSKDEQQLFAKDFKQLGSSLKKWGFIGYSGRSLSQDSPFKDDYIFEMDDYYASLIKATRENFQVKGSKQYAVLDFTDVEQRILTENRIEDHIQEDLLKWKDAYQAAQVDQNPINKLLIPAPTTNPYIQNFKINVSKYFRGDDRKILKWGLDLAGGKTVRIGLRDQNGKMVSDPEDLKQAVNELYTRINKMGVSERTIRIENQNIILDFPGSQGLSAQELVKASAMRFHIVNEKFSARNQALKDAVNKFLQGVYNEAVVTNRKDIEGINEIAWNHFGGSNETDATRPRGEIAKILYENGLRLANPKINPAQHAFDDSLSTIGILRGDDFSEWYGQTHPLVILFNNYALEGSSLTNIQVGYDSSEGNVLSFQVKSSYDSGEGSPRNDFYAWTQQFAKEEIKGTPKEVPTKGDGWRMAVLLNGRVISMPSLKAALKDGGVISGRFTQREVDQLASDLKAGSLSFTPRILSEQNVSPELGKEERESGLIASAVALILVIVAMVGYYRFAGVVACVAVLFNILVMWGVLQNLGAALTLPGIAGLVLTLGMAVDANVLVFERYREEFAISGRVASAIHAGYSKAFTAIVDSNVTTIIAALILLQFDSGPIKSFAVMLIIGIISSMFTALFMTRFFFAGWVKRNKDKPLTMSDFIGKPNINFLSYTRVVVIASVVVTAIGVAAFAAQRTTIFGMDFTGGYSLQVELKEQNGLDSYRLLAKDALVKAGAASSDVDIRQLSRPNQLRIQLSTGMEEKGRPFSGMQESVEKPGAAYEYETNPRITWVVDGLKQAGLEIPESQLASINTNWTIVSGQLSDTMRNNAIMALGLALLSILVYITLRFEFKYAIAAVIGLVHDLVITLGILALFHKIGFPVQISLEVIGAIMTIIGYSLNDTIIVFDRIREDVHIHRKWRFEDIVNHALNVTLSRTLMTSGTTMLVLLSLVFLGGKSIFAFSLVMTIGVVVGTLSSLFIASPVLLYFHNRELRKLESEHQKA